MDNINQVRGTIGKLLHDDASTELNARPGVQNRARVGRVTHNRPPPQKTQSLHDLPARW